MLYIIIYCRATWRKEVRKMILMVMKNPSGGYEGGVVRDCFFRTLFHLHCLFVCLFELRACVHHSNLYFTWSQERWFDVPGGSWWSSYIWIALDSVHFVLLATLLYHKCPILSWEYNCIVCPKTWRTGGRKSGRWSLMVMKIILWVYDPILSNIFQNQKVWFKNEEMRSKKV